MPGNFSEIQELTEKKLDKLYKEHNALSLETIKLLNLVSTAIDEGDGSKLEQYSIVHKNYFNKLLKLDIVIGSYEEISISSSVKLTEVRELAGQHQKTIKVIDKKNRSLLKTCLAGISSQIDLFSRKMLYSTSSTGNSSPQFVDLRV